MICECMPFVKCDFGLTGGSLLGMHRKMFLQNQQTNLLKISQIVYVISQFSSKVGIEVFHLFPTPLLFYIVSSFLSYHNLHMGGCKIKKANQPTDEKYLNLPPFCLNLPLNREQFAATVLAN